MNAEAGGTQDDSLGAGEGLVRYKVSERGPWSEKERRGMRPFFGMGDEQPARGASQGLGLDGGFAGLGG